MTYGEAAPTTVDVFDEENLDMGDPVMHLATEEYIDMWLVYAEAHDQLDQIAVMEFLEYPESFSSTTLEEFLSDAYRVALLHQVAH